MKRCKVEEGLDGMGLPGTLVSAHTLGLREGVGWGVGEPQR